MAAFDVVRLRFRLLILLCSSVVLVCSPGQAMAQQCASAPLCRDGGSLLHRPNSRGTLIWTTQCLPISSPRRLDDTCQRIATCRDSGGFGAFLLSVTDGCRAKHLNDYFGLDGITFGILHWTADNLPMLLGEYRSRSPEHFQDTFRSSGMRTLPNGCADPSWVCSSNRLGDLNCNADFRRSFQTAVESREFQQAQVAVALRAYEDRIRRFSSLGLRTAYGNIAIAVVANNLKSGQACRPATWKQACSGHADERALVDCMLDQYATSECRGGSPGAAAERVRSIRTMLRDLAPDAPVLPTADAAISCGWPRTGE